MRFSKNNVEDWDFRGCTPGSPDYDVEADLFYSENYTDVIVVEHIRLTTLKVLMDNGYAEHIGDGVVMLSPEGEGVLAAMPQWRDAFTRFGRLDRRVTKALLREWQKNGRLRLTILP